jgi:hypothetical protein
MRTRFRLSVIWLAATFLLMGTAFSFAATGTKHPTSHPTVSQKSEANDNGDATEVENDTNEPQDQSTPDTTTHERKLNHGYYVSQAAQCQNVDDPATAQSPDFTAPADCSGKDHGKYVSSVAKSSIGKGNKGHGKP